MKCPYCGNVRDKVVDSREGKNGVVIRRRRECLNCHRRFTSYEKIEEIPYMVIKKDGRREAFDRKKVLAGMMKAVEKRPVSMKALEDIADEIEAMVQDSPDREVETKIIGNLIMEKLKELDKVAYVRFASVYRRFEDISEFMNELKGLIETRK